MRASGLFRAPRLFRCSLAVLVLAAGCVQSQVIRGGVAVPLDTAIDADLKTARRALAAGRNDEARVVLERFLDELGSTRRSDEARFLLADVYLESGEAEQAAQLWRTVAERAPLSAQGLEARLRSAKVYRDLGQPEVGLRLLRGGDVRRLPPRLRADYHRTVADLARGSGDFATAVVALAMAQLSAASDTESSQIDLEVAELIEERLRDDELEAVVPRLPQQGRVYTRALFELARRQIARGDVQLARESLAKLPADLGEFDRAIALGLLERADRAAQFDTFPLGIEVPLTGPYAAFGRSVLRGMSLGLGLFDEEPGRYRLLVRDTAGEPERATAATRELAQEGVRMIIGPMRSIEAAASAPVAQEAGVPLLSLAVRSDLPYLGSYVFRLGVTAERQVETLVEFAMEALEAQRFAILYPRDSYGQSFKNLFWDEVERRGGVVVGVEGYPAGAVDIQEEVKKLVGLHYLTDTERERIKRRDRLERRREENQAELRTPELAELPPYIDFDALFIPDAAAQLGVVLPQLRFYDVADVALLGPSDWNDPKLLELAANEAEGAVFVDTFDPRSEAPEVKRFVERYFAAYGEAPDAYAAEAYDAALLLTGLVRSGARSRTDLAQGLLDFPRTVPQFRGVAGLVGFDEVGGSLRELSILTVRRQKIETFESIPKATQRR